MGVVFNLPVPVFNIIKYILAGLFIGVLSEFSASSLEKCRRAFLLNRYGKFQLRQGIELFQENRIFRTFRWRGRLLTKCFTTLLTILIIVGEGSLELGSDSIIAPKSQMGSVMVGGLSTSDTYFSYYWLYDAGARICGSMDDNNIRIWKMYLKSHDGQINLGCPRNTTTSYFTDNDENAKVTSKQDIFNTGVALQSAASKYGTIRIIEDSSFLLVVLIDFPRETIEEVFFYSNYARELQGIENESVGIVNLFENFECAIHRTRDPVPRVLLLGCILYVEEENVSYYYFNAYHNPEYDTIDEFSTHFLTMGLSQGKLDQDTKDKFMAIAFYICSYRVTMVPPNEHDTIVYTGNLLLKLAEDNEFKFNVESERRIIGYDQAIRPTVANWALVVFGVMITAFFVIIISSFIFIRRMFPYANLLGEDFIARVSTGSSNSWIHIGQTEEQTSRFIVSDSEPSDSAYIPNSSVVFGDL